MKLTIVGLIICAMTFSQVQAQDSLDIELAGSYQWDDLDCPEDFVITGDRAFIGARGGLAMIDISNPLDLRIMFRYDFHFSRINLRLYEQYLVVSQNNGGILHIFDLSDPDHPEHILQFDVGFYLTSIDLYNDKIICMTSQNGIVVVDISDFDNISVCGQLEGIAAANFSTVVGHYLYAGNDEGGLNIVDIQNPDSLRLVSQIFEGTGCSYVSQYNDLLCVTSSARNGDGRLDLYNVSDPENPRALTGRDFDEHLFAVHINDGTIIVECGERDIQIFDYSGVSLDYIGHYGDAFAVTKIFTRDNILYLTSLFDALTTVDIADLSNPAFLAKIGGYSRIVNTVVKDQHIFLNQGDDGIRVVDFSNPEIPEEKDCFYPFNGNNHNMFNTVYEWNENCILGVVNENDSCKFFLVDISNPDSIFKSQQISWDRPPVLFYKYGDIVLESARESDLRIWNFETFSEPVLLAEIERLNNRLFADVRYYNDYIYLSFTNGLIILDGRDVNDISVVNVIDFESPQGPTELEVFNGTLFLRVEQGRVNIYSLENPTEPELVNVILTRENVREMLIYNDILYLMSNNSITLRELNNPIIPRTIGYYTVNEAMRDMDIVDNCVYFTGEEKVLCLDCETALSVEDEHTQTSSREQLFTLYPNPFNSATTISFNLPYGSHISLQLYDLNGRLVDQLIDRVMSAGSHEVLWDGGLNATGVYLLSLKDGRGGFEDIRKVVLVR